MGANAGSEGIDSSRLASLNFLYQEIHAHYRSRDSDLVPRLLVPRALSSRIMLLGQALARKTQRLSGIPYCFPPPDHPRLSRGGLELDKFLRSFGYTIDPFAEDRQYAYHTDLAHYFPGKKGKGFGDVVPAADDVVHDRAWFEREVGLLRPVVIVALGREAADAFARRYLSQRIKKLADFEVEPVSTSVAGLRTNFLAVHHPSGAFQHPSSNNRYTRAVDHIHHLLSNK